MTRQQSDVEYQDSVDEFSYLERNASAVAMSSGGMRLLPAAQLSSLGIVPTLWPVVGEITGHFGERLDPFSGEGAFHAGMDIASHYGDAIHATADGVVAVMDQRAGYGRLVVIDHGFGVTTWYGHLSGFATHVGMHVKRGDIIGYEGAERALDRAAPALRSSHLQHTCESLALPQHCGHLGFRCGLALPAFENSVIAVDFFGIVSRFSRGAYFCV